MWQKFRLCTCHHPATVDNAMFFQSVTSQWAGFVNLHHNLGPGTSSLVSSYLKTSRTASTIDRPVSKVTFRTNLNPGSIKYSATLAKRSRSQAGIPISLIGQDRPALRLILPACGIARFGNYPSLAILYMARGS